MAGSTIEDYGTGGSSSFIEEMSNEQRCQPGDSLAEWRSCEQVENGTPSTSPPFWDTDDGDDDFGPKPSELHGKFTWKIEKFSEINKRELRSNPFEVGGYKWYILIYPQGCDVSNHLSLFLCVANHDKLLPGWSHFAQFTIAVVNKDPKKSKYSDTLHRFWKKEHDWGWKKFMELSKVADGFIVEDTLVIKAQVQVIREKAHRPFRCLDRHYRRELVRIYLSNVEQICRRFVEERRGKLSKLIEDKMRWSSFRVFWLGIDQNARRRMSRDKADAILKVVVKHFFIEKEVTSTLVMDSLYSGLMALECQSKNKKGREKLVDVDELPAPMVHVEKDMFVLADDVLLLLERAVRESMPHQPLPPKDDKASQNRIKDGITGEELNKDSIERDERRLTELGRRTVEIFVLAHIFSSKIEVAYQEAVALKRQEELIREEEAAWQVELKAKRGTAEKEKRAKKKQTRQKRNSRKGKDRGRDEKPDATLQEKHQPESPSVPSVTEKIGTLEDASDVSDTGDDVPEVLQPELEDRDTSSVNWDTDSEIHPAAEASGAEIQNGQTEKRSPSTVDDSCSTCSTDSVPSVVVNGPYKGNSVPNKGKYQGSKDTHDRYDFPHGGNRPPSDAATDPAHLWDDADRCRDPLPEPEAVGSSSKDRIQRPELHLVEKEEVAPLQKELNIANQVEAKSRTAELSSSPSSPGKRRPSVLQQPKPSSETTTTAATATTTEPVSIKVPPSNNPAQAEKPVPLVTRSPQISSASKSEAQKPATPPKSTATHQVPAMSRPLSAPLIPSPRPSAPLVSTVQTMPLLSRSVSAAGRLGTDPSPSAPSFVPHSYRNAIIGKTTMGAGPAGFTPIASTSSNQVVGHTRPPSTFISSGPMLPPQTSARNGQSSLRPGFTFGSIKPESLHGQHPWRDAYSHHEASSGISISSRPYNSNQYSGRATFGPTNQGTVSDEFPHLAIINDLLDEDPNIGRAANSHHHSFNRQYSFPRDAATAGAGSFGAQRTEQYYGEVFQRGAYGPSDGPHHAMRDAHAAQMDLSAYANGHVDGSIQNQWPPPYQHADLAAMNSGGVDADGYPYHLQDYLKSTYGMNMYNMYRPTGGL